MTTSIVTDKIAMELNEAENSFCDRERNVMRLWREAGMPEYFLGNGGTNQKLVAFAESVADDLVRAEREACERLAVGWRYEASGDNYQTSGNGNFWDDDSAYGQGRTEAAAAIHARTTKEQT